MPHSPAAFRWLNRQGVESTEQGFIVQITGRGTLDYRINDWTMKCDWEPGIPYSVVSVPPLRTFTPEQRAEIIEGLSAALDFLGMAHKIEPPAPPPEKS